MNFPPEIHIEIIGWACRMPCQALEAPPEDPLASVESLRNRTDDIRGKLADLMKTKAALSIVSKSWNNLCKEHLYEFIIVRDAAKIPAILEQMAKAGEYLRPVLRLDIVCSWYYPSTAQTTSEHIPTLSKYTLDLIAACPRLRVLTFHGNLFHAGPVTLSRVLERSSIRLEYLEWRAYGEWRNMTFLWRLMPSRGFAGSRFNFIDFSEVNAPAGYFLNLKESGKLMFHPFTLSLLVLKLIVRQKSTKTRWIITMKLSIISLWEVIDKCNCFKMQ